MMVNQIDLLFLYILFIAFYFVVAYKTNQIVYSNFQLLSNL